MFEQRSSEVEVALRRCLAAHAAVGGMTVVQPNPARPVELVPPPGGWSRRTVRAGGGGPSPADEATTDVPTASPAEGAAAVAPDADPAGAESRPGQAADPSDLVAPSPPGVPGAGGVQVDGQVLAGFRAGLTADAELLDVARAAQRAVAAAQAEQARALAAFARRRPASLDLPDDVVGAQARQSRARRPDALTAVSEFCVDEVAAALTLSGHRAEQVLSECVLLVERLPLVLVELEEGRIGWEHVRVACDLLGGLSAEIRDRAQRELVGRAAGRTAQEWRPIVRRWVMKVDADAIAKRVADAVRDRQVVVHPGADGMGTLSATLPLPVARAVEAALQEYARAARTPEDDRSAGERMADCLVSLVLDPGAHGMTAVQAELTIVVAVQTLLGGDEPGEVAGDVVPAAMVRDLARALGLLPVDDATPNGATTEADDPADVSAVNGIDRADPADRAALASLLTNRAVRGTGLAGVPRIALADQRTGELVALTDAAGIRRAVRDGVGLGPPAPSEGYRPGALLDAFVRLRDRRCRFPGCRTRAGTCDVDHQRPWSQGGATAECNLACLCTHHHRLSHQAPGWRLSREPGGTGLTWTTPTGQTITTRPPATHPAADGGTEQAERAGAGGAGESYRRDAVRGSSPRRRPPGPDRRPDVDAAPDPDPPPF